MTDILDELRAFGLTYPETALATPWPEHLNLVVRQKTFAFLSGPGHPFSMTVKLPFTGQGALEASWAQPAGYGLGRSGWVSLKPGPDEVPPLAQLKDWLDESYRAVAPKALVKRIGT